MTEHHAFLRNAYGGPVIDIYAYDDGATEHVDLIHIRPGRDPLFNLAATELAFHGWEITGEWDARARADIRRTRQ